MNVLTPPPPLLHDDQDDRDEGGEGIDRCDEGDEGVQRRRRKEGEDVTRRDRAIQLIDHERLR